MGSNLLFIRWLFTLGKWKIIESHRKRGERMREKTLFALIEKKSWINHVRKTNVEILCPYPWTFSERLEPSRRRDEIFIWKFYSLQTYWNVCCVTGVPTGSCIGERPRPSRSRVFMNPSMLSDFWLYERGPESTVSLLNSFDMIFQFFFRDVMMSLCLVRSYNGLMCDWLKNRNAPCIHIFRWLQKMVFTNPKKA